MKPYTGDKMKIHRSFYLFIFLLVLNHATQSAGTYQLIREIPVAGNGSWDYVGMDAANRHVLISHGSQLEILNADTYALDGKIMGPGVDQSRPESMTGQGVRGAAAAPDLGLGFMPNARDGSVSIFDLKSLKVLSVVKVGENPDGYVYDPATHYGFTFSNRTKSAAVVDLQAAILVATIPLGSKPEAAAADGNGNVFVNMQEKDQVTKIDANKLTVIGSWPTAPCSNPTSMAIDRTNQRLFIGCRGNTPMLIVMDATNGKIITSLPIGDRTDAAVFDADKQLIFTSNGGDGTLSVIKQLTPDQYQLQETVHTEKGFRTMTLDPVTHNLFLISAKRTTPPAVEGQPAPREVIVPDSFKVLVVGPGQG